jgi:AmmeMemoRadiSam system protein B
MRKSEFAGHFYPKTEGSLKKAIEECFTGEKGPGELPSSKRSGKLLKAVIVPHAAYQFSGMAAAWGYNALAETAIPDVFIILAPNHNAARSGISLETFLTPFGPVRVDQEFAKALAQKGTIPINDEIHQPEHGIEVQLPFLQFSLGSASEKLKIVPILVSSDLDLAKAALDIQETIIDLKRKAVFLVSSDFTHYGRNYKYMPFYKDIKENLIELDGRAFELIKKGDYKGFEAFVDETEDTICGFFPILLLLRCIKFEQASVEQYYVSGDISGDYKSSVSYASIIFK